MLLTGALDYDVDFSGAGGEIDLRAFGSPILSDPGCSLSSLSSFGVWMHSSSLVIGRQGFSRMASWRTPIASALVSPAKRLNGVGFHGGGRKHRELQSEEAERTD